MNEEQRQIIMQFEYFAREYSLELTDDYDKMKFIKGDQILINTTSVKNTVNKLIEIGIEIECYKIIDIRIVKRRKNDYYVSAWPLYLK